MSWSLYDLAPRKMYCLAVGSFTLSFIFLSASTEATRSATMDNDLVDDLSTNNSTLCYISKNSSVARLTCIFPFDIRQQRSSFNIKATRQIDFGLDTKLQLNCLWLPTLKCVGANGRVALQEDQISTNVTVEVSLQDAFSHNFTCHLTESVKETHSCFLEVNENPSSPAEENTSTVLIIVISAVSVGTAGTVFLIFVWKKLKRRKDKHEPRKNGYALSESANGDQNHHSQRHSQLITTLETVQTNGNEQTNPEETAYLLSQRQFDENGNQDSAYLKHNANTSYETVTEDLPKTETSEILLPNADTKNGTLQTMSHKLLEEKDELIAQLMATFFGRNCIIPEKYYNYIHTIPKTIGYEQVDVIDPVDGRNKTTNPILQRIFDQDKMNQRIHDCFLQIKEQFLTDEPMVVLTQTSFSLYGKDAREVPEMPVNNLEQILLQKATFSDLVIISRQRGVLGGTVLGDHINNPELGEKHLKICKDKLLKCMDVIKEVLSTIPKADDVAVHNTLVFPNINRKQIAQHIPLQEAVQSVPCLFKDDMETEEGLRNWWDTCWGNGKVMDEQVYRNLIRIFAIPAMLVQSKLTSGCTGQFSNFRGTEKGTDCGFGHVRAGCQGYCLFPSQEELLDYDSLDETQADIKMLTGPQGTGKSKLLRLRAQQWVNHFAASKIVNLQTREDGTAAACVLEHQLQQTLRQATAQTCCITHVDLSRLWEKTGDAATGFTQAELSEKGKETLQTALGLHASSLSDTAIHIVADEADGNVIRAVYQWLKENSRSIIRLWAAGVEMFDRVDDIPSELQHALVHVTEKHLFHGPTKLMAPRLKARAEKQLDLDRDLAEERPIIHLRHTKGRDGHASSMYPWRCSPCALAIFQQLKQLLVVEAIDGCRGLSANDVFILGSDICCDSADDDERSPAPLIKFLRDSGYNVRTVSHDSARNYIMSIINKTNTLPAITVSHEKYVWGLERKVIVYCEGTSDAGISGKLRALSQTTPILINIKPD